MTTTPELAKALRGLARGMIHYDATVLIEAADLLSSPSPAMDEAGLRAEAEATVERVRGSNDVPGFEACVRAEVENIRARRLVTVDET